MSDVIFRYCADADLPLSAPDNIVYFTASGFIYRGTGTGLTKYSIIHTYTNRAAFPAEGRNDHLYIDITDKALYIWNDAYIPVDIEGTNSYKLTIQHIINSTVIGNEHSGKILCTSNTSGDIVITLPSLEGYVKFTLINDSIHKCTIQTDNLIYTSMGSSDHFDLLEGVVVELMNIGDGWVMSNVVDTYTDIQKPIKYGYIQATITNSDLVFETYSFKHMLGNAHVGIVVYDNADVMYKNMGVEILSDNEVSVQFNHHIEGTWKVVAYLGGNTHKVPEEHEEIPDTITVLTPTIASTLNVDFSTCKMVSVVLGADVSLNMVALSADVTRVCLLKLSQSAYILYSAMLNKEAASANILTSNGDKDVTPDLGKESILTFLWDGTRFILTKDGNNLIPIV